MNLSLREKRCILAQHIAALIQEAKSLGYEIALNECLRTQAQAMANAASGAGIAHSLHLVGLAVDVALYHEGAYLTTSDAYSPLGVWWEARSTTDYTLCWGGRFSKPDGNHFSMMHNGIK